MFSVVYKTRINDDVRYAGTGLVMRFDRAVASFARLGTDSFEAKAQWNLKQLCLCVVLMVITGLCSQTRD